MIELKQTETYEKWEARRRGNLLIVLLCGGDNSTQARDITAAKKLAKEWSNQDD